ncbi:MAG: DUF3617 family protein, partial [Pseudomonadales bacterium]|nr:DUF3617 family protein [Pseudomonadales bacterium]
MTSTSQNCVEENTYNPENLLEGAEHCTMQESGMSGDTFRFRMQCSMHGTTANVAGSYTNGGDTGEGDMDVQMKMGPMDMKLEMQWKSTYLGDC